MPRHDVIVIGAGANGLTTAALLARAGRQVLVLEARSLVGGLAACEEFYPGYRSAGFFQDTTLVQRALVEALGLESHGLRWRPEGADVLALGRPGDSLLLAGNLGRAADALARRNPRDAEQLRRYVDFLESLRPVVTAWMHGLPLDPTDDDALRPWSLLRRGLRLPRLRRPQLLELLRLPTLSVADALGEWFEDDLLQAALALPALGSTWMGPRSPGSYALLLRHLASAGPGTVGGGPGLIAALASAARAFGAEIRLSAAVDTIQVNGRVRGVKLSDGEELQASTVVASCHPRSVFLSLLAPQSIPARLQRKIEALRSRGTTAQVLLALRSPLRFRGHGSVEFARLAPSLDDMERAFDAVKYGRLPSHPVLEIHSPSMSHPELAPKGGAVMAILAHFAPHTLHESWNDGQRRSLENRVVEWVSQHTEGMDVVASTTLAPPDLESRYRLPGGHVHHGEHALDQLLLRPATGCMGYATPIDGLFLCGSGSHPGGGLTCTPGALAAQVILAS